MSDRRRDAATTAVGVAGVAGGAVVRESGLQRAHALAGKSKRVFIPSRALLMAPKSNARGKARLLWAGGTGLAAAATPAAAVGAHRLARPDRASKRARTPHRDGEEHTFLGEGVRGAAEALRERGESTLSAPRQARGVPLAAGLAGGGLGAQAGHKVMDAVARRTPVNAKARAAVTSLSAVGGGLASMPAANAALRRRAPGYTITPTGVKRVKSVPVRPSRRASTARGRRDIVPSDDRFTKYYGENMSRGQKRARVLAAGTVPIPIVNDIAAASQAARMAPPEQRRSAFANTAGGIGAGTVVGAGAGAAAGRALERRHPGLAQRAVDTDEAVREKVRTSRPVQAAAATPPAQAAARARAKLPKGGGRLKGKLTPAVLLGAGLGQMPGGQAGGWMGYSRTLDAEARYKRERRAKLAKSAGLSQREREKLARTKRHSAALSVIGGTAGVGALAALGGSRLKLLRPATRARLSAAQTPLLTTGAGTGGINAFLGAKVQNREAKQVEAAKALVPLRPRSYVDSHLRRRRTASGLTTTSRVRAGVR